MGVLPKNLRGGRTLLPTSDARMQLLTLLRIRVKSCTTVVKPHEFDFFLDTSTTEVKTHGFDFSLDLSTTELKTHGFDFFLGPCIYVVTPYQIVGGG